MGSSQSGEGKERSHKPTYIDTEKMRVFLLLMVVSTVFGCLRNSQSFFETEYNDFLSTQKCFGGNCQVNTKVTNCDGQECEGMSSAKLLERMFLVREVIL